MSSSIYRHTQNVHRLIHNVLAFETNRLNSKSVTSSMIFSQVLFQCFLAMFMKISRTPVASCAVLAMLTLQLATHAVDTSPLQGLNATTFLSTVVNYRHNPNHAHWVPDSPYVDLLSRPLAVWTLFDWVIYGDIALFKQPIPRTVICKPDDIVVLIDKLVELPPTELKRISLVVAGGDYNASFGLAAALEHLKSSGHGDITLFDLVGQIWWEAKDIYDDRIKTIPMGLIAGYVLRNNIERVVASIHEGSAHVKPRFACSTWGAIWGDLDGNAAHVRHALDKFLHEEEWIHRDTWPFEKYYQNMGECFYFLAPQGKGIQSPKFAEAWLMRAIPVSLYTPAFADLQAMGFPIVLVDDWHQLSEISLETAKNTRFATIDWDAVHYKLTNNYARELVIGTAGG